VNTPDQMRAELAAGRVDVILVPTNVAANLYNRGVDVQFLGVFEMDLMHLVGPPGTQGWDGLRGQTVLIPFQGDILDLAFQALAPANGLVIGEDVAVEYAATPPEVLSALLQGRVSFGLLPEPLASVALARAGAEGVPLERIVNVADSWREQFGGELVTPSFVVTTEFAESHPAVVAALQEELGASLEDVVARSADVAPALAEPAQLPVPVVAEVLSRLAPEFRVDARDDIESYLSVLAEVSPESVGGQLPPAAIYG
jgi:NitT/TauT family transport system substrate-binding protein